jgi:transposase
MKRFVTGENRSQEAALSGRLDDYVAEDNLVRVVDAFVDRLDLIKLGFKGMIPKATGRPGYHPAVLLKLYIHNYLNRIQSSRRIAGECRRNLEVMWLTGRLTPAFKTIASFRKTNGAAICKVCREFVLLCRKLNLLTSAKFAIDGSKFKAVNARDKNFTQAKVKKRLQQIEDRLERRQSQLETARRQPSTAKMRIDHLEERIETLQLDKERLNLIGALIAKGGEEKQISLTDPDARSMTTSSGEHGTVGYNVQCVVDAKTHLIIAHEVTNVGTDSSHLAAMVQQAQEILDVKSVEAAADRGYYKGEEILACEQAGATVYIPRRQTSELKAKGLFGKQDFVYVASENVYICPAGKRLTYRFTNVEDGKRLHAYWTTDCPACPLKEKCTTGKIRRIRRWEHEAVLEVVQDRLDRNPQMMSMRRSVVEHPFGTLKFWMGAVHFLMKGIPNVRTEMALHILSYNIKRVINIIGVDVLLQSVCA